MLEIIINNSSITSTDKTLESKSQKNKYEDETIDQNKIKNLNDLLYEKIDKSKSFEDQIESLKNLERLKEYCFMEDFDDKELKFKIFKIHLADMSNKDEEKLFETIFSHKLVKLADNLKNTTNKEKNQITVNSICKNKNKLFEMDGSNDWVIQPNSQRITLLYAIDFILNFNKTIQLDLVLK